MKGFSLIELIVVLFILGLVAGAVAPAFLAGRGHGQDSQTADRVEAVVRRARKLSLDRGTVATLSLNVVSGSYLIRLDAPRAPEDAGTPRFRPARAFPRRTTWFRDASGPTAPPTCRRSPPSKTAGSGLSRWTAGAAGSVPSHDAARAVHAHLLDDALRSAVQEAPDTTVLRAKAREAA